MITVEPAIRNGNYLDEDNNCIPISSKWKGTTSSSDSNTKFGHVSKGLIIFCVFVGCISLVVFQLKQSDRCLHIEKEAGRCECSHTTNPNKPNYAANSNEKHMFNYQGGYFKIKRTDQLLPTTIKTLHYKSTLPSMHVQFYAYFCRWHLPIRNLGIQ